MRSATNGKYVAFGDSITEGWLSSDVAHRYVTLLGQKLNSLVPGFTVKTINVGIAGNRAYDLLARVYQDVCSYEPTIVTIMCGTNDVRWARLVADYIADMTKVIDAIKNNCPWAVIYLANPPYMTQFNTGSAALQTEYNAQIPQLATSKGCKFVDIYAATLNRSDLLDADGFHPNDVGHQVLADTWFASISKQFAVAPTDRPYAARKDL